MAGKSKVPQQQQPERQPQRGPNGFPTLKRKQMGPNGYPKHEPYDQGKVLPG